MNDLMKHLKNLRETVGDEWSIITPLIGKASSATSMIRVAAENDRGNWKYVRDSKIIPFMDSQQGIACVNTIVETLISNWKRIAAKIREIIDVDDKYKMLIMSICGICKERLDKQCPELNDEERQILVISTLSTVGALCSKIESGEKFTEKYSSESAIVMESMNNNTLNTISAHIAEELAHRPEIGSRTVQIRPEDCNTLRVDVSQYVFTVSALEGIVANGPSAILHHYVGAKCRKVKDDKSVEEEIVYDAVNADWYTIRLIDTIICNAANMARAKIFNMYASNFKNINNADNDMYITRKSLEEIVSKFYDEYLAFMQLDDTADVIVDIYADMVSNQNYIIRLVTGNIDEPQVSYMDISCQEIFLTVNPIEKAVMISNDFPWVSTGFDLYAMMPFEIPETDFVSYTHKNAIQCIMHNLFKYDLAKFTYLKDCDRKTPEETVNKFVEFYVYEIATTFGIKDIDRIKPVVKSFNDGTTTIATGKICVTVAIDGVGLVDGCITEEVTRRTSPGDVLCTTTEEDFSNAITWEQSKDATNSFIGSACNAVSIAMNKMYANRNEKEN